MEDELRRYLTSRQEELNRIPVSPGKLRSIESKALDMKKAENQRSNFYDLVVPTTSSRDYQRIYYGQKSRSSQHIKQKVIKSHALKHTAAFENGDKSRVKGGIGDFWVNISKISDNTYDEKSMISGDSLISSQTDKASSKNEKITLERDFKNQKTAIITKGIKLNHPVVEKLQEEDPEKTKDPYSPCIGRKSPQMFTSLAGNTFGEIAGLKPSSHSLKSMNPIDPYQFATIVMANDVVRGVNTLNDAINPRNTESKAPLDEYLSSKPSYQIIKEISGADHYDVYYHSRYQSKDDPFGGLYESSNGQLKETTTSSKLSPEESQITIKTPTFHNVSVPYNPTPKSIQKQMNVDALFTPAVHTELTTQKYIKSVPYDKESLPGVLLISNAFINPSSSSIIRSQKLKEEPVNSTTVPVESVVAENGQNIRVTIRKSSETSVEREEAPIKSDENVGIESNFQNSSQFGLDLEDELENDLRDYLRYGDQASLTPSAEDNQFLKVSKELQFPEAIDKHYLEKVNPIVYNQKWGQSSKRNQINLESKKSPRTLDPLPKVSTSKPAYKNIFHSIRRKNVAYLPPLSGSTSQLPTASSATELKMLTKSLSTPKFTSKSNKL